MGSNPSSSAQKRIESTGWGTSGDEGLGGPTSVLVYSTNQEPDLRSRGRGFSSTREKPSKALRERFRKEEVSPWFWSENTSRTNLRALNPFENPGRASSQLVQRLPNHKRLPSRP